MALTGMEGLRPGCRRRGSVRRRLLAEHWDVLQDEATKAESVSGLSMFGDSFPSKESPLRQPFTHKIVEHYESHWKHYFHYRRRIGHWPRAGRSAAQTRQQSDHLGSAQGHLDASKANPGIEATNSTRRSDNIKAVAQELIENIRILMFSSSNAGS